MAVLPAEIPTGLVTGQFYFVNEDNIDADTDPDLTVVTGKVRFICEAKEPLRMPTKKAVVIPLTFDAEFDSQGRLVPAGRTEVGIELPATNSSLFSPTNFTWRVEFDLVDVSTGYTVVIPSFSMSVPQGATTDLVDAMPVSTSPGTITVQGPQGIQGIQGTSGPTGAGVPTGGAALQMIRRKADNSTTEWFTAAKGDVGLGNVDNTSDSNKPVSTATATAIALKLDVTANRAQQTTVHPVTDPPSTFPLGLSYFGAGAADGYPVGLCTVMTLRNAVSRSYQTATGKISGDVWVRAETDVPVADSWTAWKRQATTDVATSVLDGLMSASDKAKLDAATAAATDGTLVTRYNGGETNFKGVYLSAAPVSASHATRKDYVDTQAANASNLTTGTVSAARLPVATASVPGTMSAADKALLDGATSAATNGALAQRNSAGRIGVSEPGTDVTAATPKSYVDAMVWDGSDITTGTISDARIANATSVLDGLMPKADKAKLDAATQSATASTLALRSATGTIDVATPTVAAHAARKDYVDGKTWDGADITTGTVSAARLPVATASVPGTMSAADKAILDGATAAATGLTLAKRYSDGRMDVTTPTGSGNAANKSYVDAQVTVKLTATKGTAVANATDAASAITQLNALLASLRAANIIS